MIKPWLVIHRLFGSARSVINFGAGFKFMKAKEYLNGIEFDCENSIEECREGTITHRVDIDNFIPLAMCQFDCLIQNGWKLNLISGQYSITY